MPRWCDKVSFVPARSKTDYIDFFHKRCHTSGSAGECDVDKISISDEGVVSVHLKCKDCGETSVLKISAEVPTPNIIRISKILKSRLIYQD